MLHVQLLANKITVRIQILDGTNFLLSTQHGPVAIVNFHSQLRPFSRFHGFNFMVLLFICQWNMTVFALAVMEYAVGVSKFGKNPMTP